MDAIWDNEALMSGKGSDIFWYNFSKIRRRHYRGGGGGLVGVSRCNVTTYKISHVVLSYHASILDFLGDAKAHGVLGEHEPARQPDTERGTP